MELLEYNLVRNGYDVVRAGTGGEALSVLRDRPVDLVLLDCMMPEMDGLDVLRAIRSDLKLVKMPVILLTARSDEMDKVLGLELGADDYISKPFGVRELLARVKALLRRCEAEEVSEGAEKIRIGTLVLNEVAREVFVNGCPVTLSLKEFDLLRLLVKNRNRVFTREQLLDQVWGYEYSGETRTVDVHVRSLRKKLEEDPEDPQYIRTVRGVGYKFVAE